MDSSRSTAHGSPSAAASTPPTLAATFPFWLKLGFISFGGPAGQIAIMHREVVERRGWMDERGFMRALNFCMLLPGPEALQLAIYLGWRMHGVRGGLVAGLCFFLPAVALLLGLSFIYVLYGEVPAVAAALTGLKAVVVALIAQAVVKVASRALRGPVALLLATGGFLALAVLHIAFPWVLAAAAAAGMLLLRPSDGAAEPAGATQRRVLPAGGVLAGGLLLWLLPLALVTLALGGGSLYAKVYLFFTQVALVTFGGAYAVLAYVNQQVVESLGWITQAQAVAGLALAETTPGPLVIVLQFMGFMAGWNDPGTLGQAQGAVLAALLAAWATFLPSFVFIFLGAPHLAKLQANPRLAGAMAGITAAVVGVIASLAVSFGRAVLLPGGAEAPAWGAIAIALAALALLLRTRLDVLWVIAGGALAGLLLGAA
ncbi:MAG: chromate efflux transporter [Steroidobacteraceae bacterium]|nr:chromate efflux transporter [Steroidobacteraceae bacterium]